MAERKNPAKAIRWQGGALKLVALFFLSLPVFGPSDDWKQLDYLLAAITYLTGCIHTLTADILDALHREGAP